MRRFGVQETPAQRDARRADEATALIVRTGMLKALEKVQHAGSFAAHAKMAQPPPNGKTPEFEIYVKNLCKKVASQLGINGTINAELYKMLIYGKGAMFKPHTDTEKIPGMFGTLVISLPSPHQGGDVVVKHCGRKHVYKTSQHEHSYICWYSDVSHEVLPVTSGYRWVLTYNLAIDPSQPRPTAALQESGTIQELQKALNAWLSAGARASAIPYIHHVLDHDYTQANTSLRSLKTLDLARVQALKDLCKELPVEIFLSLIEKEEMGCVEFDYCSYDAGVSEDEESYHHIDDVLEETHVIKNLYDLDGTLVTENVHFDEDHMLDASIFMDMVGEESSYEGYMGNSGPTATHMYRLSRPSINPSSMDQLVRLFVEVCRSQDIDVAGRAVQEVLKAALATGRYKFFEKAADMHLDDLPVDFFASAMAWTKKGGDVSANTRFDAIKTGLKRAILRYHHFNTRFKAIATTVPISTENPASEQTLQWAREVIAACLASYPPEVFGRLDGKALVDMASYFEDPHSFLATSVVPLVKQRTSHASFTLGFLNRLYSQCTNGKFPQEACMELYRPLAKSFVIKASFSQMQCPAAVQQAAMMKRMHYSDGSLTADEHRLAVSPDAMSYFVTTVVKLSPASDGLAAELTAQLCEASPYVSGPDRIYLWHHVLRNLVDALEANAIPLDTKIYQDLYKAWCKALLEKYVKHEPSRNRSLVRPRVNCPCRDCEKLNAFLVDPSRLEGRFPLNKARRMHIHQQLDAARIDCTHTTERVGSPQTLVVHKANSAEQVLERNWEARRKEAADFLDSFDQDKLRLLLGEEYEDVVGMKKILNGPPRPLPVRGANATGDKRKRESLEVEVIDLVSD